MSYNNTTVHSCQTMIEYDLVQMIAQASFVIFILLLNVCGNCMVCAAIFSYRRLRTVTNCFIVSLAVSDLLVAGLSMPFRIHHTLHSMCWDLGIGVCQFWIFVDLLCSSASICNLSMVSIDRFLALSHPLTYPSIMTRKRALVAIALVWTYSLIIAFLSFTGPWDPNGSMQSIPACQKNDKYYYTFAITVGFFLPMLILVVNYSLVFKVAFVQARKLRILSCATLEQNETSDITNHNGARQSVVSIGRIERKRRKSIIRELKATKTLAIVVGTFILCWLPFFIIMFTHQFCPDCYREVLSPDAQLGIGTVFVYVLPLLNSAVNPIIYSSFNADFRRAFRNMLFRLCVMHRWYGKTDMQTTRSMADIDMDYTFHNTNIRRENMKLPVNIYQNGNPPKIVIHEANSDNEEEQDGNDSM